MESEVLRVHVNFAKRIKQFMKEYEEKYGIEISSIDSTKILDDKLEKVGGLKV